MAAITDALADPGITDDMQTALNNLHNFLQEVSDNLIEQTEQAWADALSAQNKQLQAFAQQIGAEVKKLAVVSDAIKKVSDTVGTLVGVVSGLVSGGIL
ncbi:MAG TPA: hypothetical protein DCO83_08355 [Mucilaginibacter sp.]|jgi:uncharacterized protein (DUF3084 family)|nr:hypothetical protein [Mucilaginibacter sp.]